MARKKPAAPPKKPPKPPQSTYALPSGGWRGFPRVISVLVLIAVVMLVAALFFRVIASFIVPLFLAAVLVVVFEPLHKWVTSRISGRPNVAAGVTTTLIVFFVLLPFSILGWKAAVEVNHLYDYLTKVEIVETEGPTGKTITREETVIQRLIAKLNIESNSNDPERKPLDPLEGKLKERFGFCPDLDVYSSKVGEWILRAGLASVWGTVFLLIGSVIMIFALFYFLADGPAMLKTLMHLSPLDDDQEQQLLEKFSEVSRAVVVASLVSAVIQGILGGIGYSFVLPEGAPLFLLTVVTMLLAIVPFVGATAVWIPVAVWVWFFQPRFDAAGEVLKDAAGNDVVGNPWVAAIFAVYGLVVVSGVDNVIKPLVLHGQSKLHPLLALLSVLGGVQVLGPIGILVGPMLIAFLQALLGMLRKELDEIEREQPGPMIEVQIPADTPITVLPIEQAPPAT
jgi:predicted PurR-regulated permease PerM